MTLRESYKYFKDTLSTIFEPEEIQALFYTICEIKFDLTRTAIHTKSELILKENLVSDLKEIVDRLQKNEPVQYILGKTYFYDLIFNVTPDTLIPRPETEELVKWILDDFGNKPQNISLLDIGTGSGCIPIALKKNLKKAEVSTADISDKAIAIAKQNAAENYADVNFVCCNILDENLRNKIFQNKTFDIIVSNPPYVREIDKTMMHANVLDYEPHLALFVSDTDPLIFYREITRFAVEYLKPGGCIYFEINEFLGNEMLELMHNYGFINCMLKTDLFNKTRMLKAQKQ